MAIQPRDALGRFASFDPLTSRRASLRAEQAALAKQRMVRTGRAGVTSGTQVFMKEILEEASVRVAEVLTLEVELFTKSLANKTRRNRDDRVRGIHEKAGKLAQAATLRSFRQKHPRKGYSRSKSRMANGAMAKAINSKTFFTARYDGVSFANRAILDQTAKQWYRLNFGAGRAGQNTKTPKSYNIEFFGAVSGELSLKGFGPSKAFTMPPGAWINRTTGDFGRTGRTEGSGKFKFKVVGDAVPGASKAGRRGAAVQEFLAGGANSKRILQLSRGIESGKIFFYSKARPTKGIVGSNYLDAGVRSLSKNLSEGWTILMREWFAEAANTGTGPIALAAKDLNFNSADIAAMNNKLAKLAGEMKLELAKFESPLR